MKITKLFLVTAALGFTACPPPNVLTSNTFLGNAKLTKSYVTQRGDDQKLFDYSVRVCDLKGDDATQTNCKDTVIIERVIR